MQTNTSTKVEISSLYVLKALCAWGVVALHAPSGYLTPYIQLIASITVPIFFMITGYFLYTTDESKLQTRLSSSIKKILIVMLITHVVYALRNLSDIPSPSQWVLWFKWIVLGQHYSAGHLWYLTALVEALFFFFLLTRWGYSKYIAYFASFWLLRFVFSDYRELIFGSPSSFLDANVLFFGIPCVATGFAIRKHQAKLLKFGHWGIACLSSIALMYVVKFIFNYSTIQLFNYSTIQLFNYSTIQLFNYSTIQLFNYSTIILLPILRLCTIITTFVLALRYSDYGRASALEYVGKSLSGNIYYWHDMMIVFVSFAFGQWIFDNYGALLAAILSTLLAYIVVWVQKKLHIHYLP